MHGDALLPWMLRMDWRNDPRAFLTVDLASWPADQPFDPLPPVPLIGIGDAAHPQAHGLDLVLEPPFSLASLSAAIAHAPQASATLVQLLRATEALPPDRAIIAESFAFAMLQAGSEHAAWRAAREADKQLPSGILHIRRDGATLDLLLERPDAGNAIDRDMRDALYDAFSLAALDDSIARVRLRSTGRTFSMGADLAEFGTTRDPVEAHAIRMRTLPALPLMRRANITEAHIQGGCVGSGLEIAAFAGRVTASSDAWFQLPETGMGILPGAGGTVSVPRRIGRQRAALLMLSGKRIGAATALGWGLIDRIMDEPSVD